MFQYKPINTSKPKKKTNTVIALIGAAILALWTIGSWNTKAYWDTGRNPDGEKHPNIAISKVGDLADFARLNCDKETHRNIDKIIWYSKENGIKPEMVLAISWSDSTCGKNLTTNWNFGNYGNNDRGDRRGYPNAFSGYKAIVDGLANGTHMTGLYRLGELSQGGRSVLGTQFSCADAPTPYKCWASSEYNWNHNAKAALQIITGDMRLDESWEFRL